MNESVIEFARPDAEVVVIRISGRGSFLNSIEIQNLCDSLREKNHNIRIIIDLEKCETMDSTFMGTLAGLSVEQNKGGEGYLTVVNTNDHTNRLLRNLGLSYILDMRDQDAIPQISENHFQKAEEDSSPSRFEQVIHMIKAHKQLINLDDQNEIRFQSVLKYLEVSLAREKKKKETS